MKYLEQCQENDKRSVNVSYFEGTSEGLRVFNQYYFY